MFGQFASTTQFYLYGKSNCTSSGWEKHALTYGNTPEDTILPTAVTYDSLASARTDNRNLRGNVYMITGANAGIGKEIVTYLAAKGATVFMVCRNADRAAQARNEIVEHAKVVGISNASQNVRVLVGDCSLESDVRRVWSEFESNQENQGRLDCLICNAGALSFEKTLTSEGIETTFAAHLLFGTYLLGTLAMNTLSNTPNSRMVVVSSGGMYNTAFPSWADATNTGISRYDGQLAYAYAKRGQVLLCERWAQLYDSRVKVVSCHPGWTDTPGVDSAYGSAKSYLQPLRTLWQGAEGIIWLAVAPAERLQGGAFYLDRSPCVKHMAGPFFTEGSFTKNSVQEVDEMMDQLEKWSNVDSRPTTGQQQIDRAKMLPLTAATSFSVDMSAFMGRWFVLANVPSYFEKSCGNCIENYVWNAEKNRVDVTFSYRSKGANEDSSLTMKAKVVNAPVNTHWLISPKLVGSVFMPINLDYLIIDKGMVQLGTEQLEYVTIGVPTRSYLWIMIRSEPTEYVPQGEDSSIALEVYQGGKAVGDTLKWDLEKATLDKAIGRAVELGYDAKLILRVPWTSKLN